MLLFVLSDHIFPCNLTDVTNWLPKIEVKKTAIGMSQVRATMMRTLRSVRQFRYLAGILTEQNLSIKHNYYITCQSSIIITSPVNQASLLHHLSINSRPSRVHHAHSLFSSILHTSVGQSIGPSISQPVCQSQQEQIRGGAERVEANLPEHPLLA